MAKNKMNPGDAPVVRKRNDNVGDIRKIQKNGKGIGVRIPAALADEMGIDPCDEVRVYKDGDRIVIDPNLKRKPKKESKPKKKAEEEKKLIPILNEMYGELGDQYIKIPEFLLRNPDTFAGRGIRIAFTYAILRHKAEHLTAYDVKKKHDGKVYFMIDRCLVSGFLGCVPDTAERYIEFLAAKGMVSVMERKRNASNAFISVNKIDGEDRDIYFPMAFLTEPKLIHMELCSKLLLAIIYNEAFKKTGKVPDGEEVMVKFPRRKVRDLTGWSDWKMGRYIEGLGTTEFMSVKKTHGKSTMISINGCPAVTPSPEAVTELGKTKDAEINEILESIQSLHSRLKSLT